jgi:SHS2 domain-containing protein
VSHRFLENIVTADVAFEATGKTPEELFTSAAEAMEEAQVDTKQLTSDGRRKIRLEGDSLEDLLFDFLNELIFLKDTEQLVFNKFDIKTHQHEGIWKLEGTMSGEKIDPKRHELRADVKAVTKHRFGIKKTAEGLKATIVLDI